MFEGVFSTWGLIRAAGLVAYALLWASTVSGVACGVGQPPSRRAMWTSLHEVTSRWALWVTLMHVVVLLYDRYQPWTLARILWPIAGPYRPWPVFLGAVAFWGLFLTLASFDLRRILPASWWKVMHRSTIFVYFGATMHGILAGTDTTDPAIKSMYVVSLAVVVVVTVVRAFRANDSARRRGTVDGRELSRDS